MYAEVKEIDRLANIRVKQALETGAEILATACPYCHVMLGNATRDLGQEHRLKVMDIGEIVAEALGLPRL